MKSNKYSIQIDNGKIVVNFLTPINKYVAHSFFDILNAPCFNSDMTQLSFFASSCEHLSSYLKQSKGGRSLSYNQTNNLIHYLEIQQRFLERNEHIFYTFNPDDILIIDNSIFICLSSSYLKTVKNGFILFKSPFEKILCSNEIIEINKLPAKCSRDSALCSLANLAFFVLFKTEYSSSTSFYLDTIKYTKLYWCLFSTFRN